jgi:hypothetical protein
MGKKKKKGRVTPLKQRFDVFDIHLRNPKRKRKVSTRYEILDVNMDNEARPIITTRGGKRFSLARNVEEGGRLVTHSSSILHTMVGFEPRSAHPLEMVPIAPPSEPDFG